MQANPKMFAVTFGIHFLIGVKKEMDGDGDITSDDLERIAMQALKEAIPGSDFIFETMDKIKGKIESISDSVDAANADGKISATEAFDIVTGIFKGG